MRHLAGPQGAFLDFFSFLPLEILVPHMYSMSLYAMRDTNYYDILSFFHTPRTNFYPLLAANMTSLRMYRIEYKKDIYEKIGIDFK